LERNFFQGGEIEGVKNGDSSNNTKGNREKARIAETRRPEKPKTKESKWKKALFQPKRELGVCVVTAIRC